jgi:hypothetical protein
MVMAMYHLHGQLICRSDGRSAVVAAAYRSGQALFDERLGKEFDYRRKRGVEESVILLPDGAPAWLGNRAVLWNVVEDAERRANSQLAREFDIAIPVELVRKNRSAAKKLVRRWARKMFGGHGLVVDISFHDFDTDNPHVHVMVTTRSLAADCLDQPEGSRHVFDRHKCRKLNDRGYMDFWRECWADMANAALAAEGIDARIDHRTLLEQGITDREPGVHIGPNANGMERRGVDTDRSLENAVTWYRNEKLYWKEVRSYVEWLDESEAEDREAERLRIESEHEAARQREADRAILAHTARLDDLATRLENAKDTRRDKVKAARSELQQVGHRLDACIERIFERKAERLNQTVAAVAVASSRVIASHRASLSRKQIELAKVGLGLDAAIDKVMERKAERVSHAVSAMHGLIPKGLALKQQFLSNVKAAFVRARPRIDVMAASLAAVAGRLSSGRSQIGACELNLAALSQQLDGFAALADRSQNKLPAASCSTDDAKPGNEQAVATPATGEALTSLQDRELAQSDARNTGDLPQTQPAERKWDLSEINANRQQDRENGADEYISNLLKRLGNRALPIRFEGGLPIIDVAKIKTDERLFAETFSDLLTPRLLAILAPTRIEVEEIVREKIDDAREVVGGVPRWNRFIFRVELQDTALLMLKDDPALAHLEGEIVDRLKRKMAARTTGMTSTRAAANAATAGLAPSGVAIAASAVGPAHLQLTDKEIVAALQERNGRGAE